MLTVVVVLDKVPWFVIESMSKRKGNNDSKFVLVVSEDFGKQLDLHCYLVVSG